MITTDVRASSGLMLQVFVALSDKRASLALALAHILDGTSADGDKHVRQVEKEVAAHHRPLHLAVRLVPLDVQRHPLSGPQYEYETTNEKRDKHMTRHGETVQV